MRKGRVWVPQRLLDVYEITFEGDQVHPFSLRVLEDTPERAIRMAEKFVKRRYFMVPGDIWQTGIKHITEVNLV